MSKITNIKAAPSGVYGTANRGGDPFDVILSTGLPRWNDLLSASYLPMTEGTKIFYIDDDSIVQCAAFSRCENGIIFGKTVCPNGDLTLDHEIPATIIDRIEI
ncbi:MAG: hypothetical protein ING75_17170 [Rhodocyclaceae bacterium]|nr:hypothetical protein [Rhodocyclaceae bacterium]